MVEIPDEPHEVGVHDLQSDRGSEIGKFVIPVNLTAPAVIGDDGERTARQAAGIESQSGPLLCLQNIFFNPIKLRDRRSLFRDQTNA